MIRAATTGDVPRILALCAEMSVESPAWSRFVHSPERIAEAVSSLIQSEDGFVWVAERGELVGGFMLGTASQHWACDVEVVSELMLYVHPSLRGTLAAARLIAQFVGWAEARPSRPQLLSVGASTGINHDLTRRLYERLGFTTASIGLERVHV
jgi:GNAT superfamily N-acetyltransferase